MLTHVLMPMPTHVLMQSGLDSEMAASLMETLVSLARKGRTVGGGRYGQ